MRVETNGQTNTITVIPDDGKHSATVILLHGLGDSANGWQDVAEQWATAHPHMKFILPTAPSIPVTLNGGMSMPAWYDIVGLTDRASESCEGIEKSIETIKEFIEADIALGIRHDRILLAGFSQGGALSLFCGLQLPVDRKPAGILVMSGYLPGASKFNLTPGFEDVKVLHCHGTADPVVKFGWAEATKSGLKAKGMQSYELKAYRGMPHSITAELVDYASQFLASVLPHDASLALKPKLPSEMSVKELKSAIRHAGLSAQAVGFSEKREFVNLLTEHLASKE